jgi:hypothetical protein
MLSLLFLTLPVLGLGTRQPATTPVARDFEEELLWLIGEGEMYVSRALLLAELHVKAVGLSGQIADSMADLANLRGTRPDMAERGLHRWVRRQMWGDILPLPYEFELPIKDPTRPGGVKKAWHAALLPHEVISSVHAKSRPLFQHLFEGSLGNLAHWWLQSSDTEWCRRHPCHGVQHDASRRVPIGIHGDDAGTFFSEKVLVLSWNSVAVSLSTMDNRILFACCDLNKAVEGVTLQELNRVLLWSFRALLQGKFPYEDHLGRAFTRGYHPERWRLRGQDLTSQGFIGAFSEVRGDWKWIWETFMFEQYYNAQWCCHFCDAHQSRLDRLYTQFGRNDPLRGTRYSHDEMMNYYVQRPPWRICVLVLIPGFYFWRVWCDALHTMDLGVYQCAAASAMWELTATNHIWPGRSRRLRLEHAYAEYKEWCRLNHVTDGMAKPFTTNMFKKKTNQGIPG